MTLLYKARRVWEQTRAECLQKQALIDADPTVKRVEQMLVAAKLQANAKHGWLTAWNRHVLAEDVLYKVENGDYLISTYRPHSDADVDKVIALLEAADEFYTGTDVDKLIAGLPKE